MHTLDLSYQDEWIRLMKDEEDKKSDAKEQENLKNASNDKLENNNSNTQEIFEFINIEDDNL